MWRNHATSTASGLLLVGVVLAGLLAAADAQVQLAPTQEPSFHRMRRSLLTQSMTCDGKVHELSMPDAPYPDTIPFAPIVNQPFFACHRPKQGLDAESNGECGAAPRYECENHVFEPVLYGSGQTPGIISPNNPVTITLKEDSDFYLTYLEWTAVDVGTAGARLRGVYGGSSDLSPVTVNYAWTWNGRNAMGEFGPCSSCKQNQGIKMMNVSSITGAGFRSFQLSQMFVNTQCAGGSGVNYDGLYWHGMKYACVRVSSLGGVCGKYGYLGWFGVWILGWRGQTASCRGSQRAQTAIRRPPRHACLRGWEVRCGQAGMKSPSGLRHYITLVSWTSPPSVSLPAAHLWGH
jgi:hypothetical protein